MATQRLPTANDLSKPLPRKCVDESTRRRRFPANLRIAAALSRTLFLRRLSGHGRSELLFVLAAVPPVKDSISGNRPSNSGRREHRRSLVGDRAAPVPEKRSRNSFSAAGGIGAKSRGIRSRRVSAAAPGLGDTALAVGSPSRCGFAGFGNPAPSASLQPATKRRAPLGIGCSTRLGG